MILTFFSMPEPETLSPLAFAVAMLAAALFVRAAVWLRDRHDFDGGLRRIAVAAGEQEAWLIRSRLEADGVRVAVRAFSDSAVPIGPYAYEIWVPAHIADSAQRAIGRLGLS